MGELRFTSEVYSTPNRVDAPSRADDGGHTASCSAPPRLALVAADPLLSSARRPHCAALYESGWIDTEHDDE